MGVVGHSYGGLSEAVMEVVFGSHAGQSSGGVGHMSGEALMTPHHTALRVMH